jgi:hypothetical protein
MGDGTDNFGTLSLRYGDNHNYYEWTTSEPTTQDYDIVVRYRLPDGFSSFDATEPIKLFNMVSDDSGNTKASIALYDTNNAVVTLAATGGTFSTPWLTLLQNESWQETTVTKTDGTFTAGGYVTIKIRLLADQGDTADVGELTLKGNW